MRGLRRLLRGVIGAFLALLVLFEEWGWEPLGRAVGRLARWAVWHGLERWVAGLPPYGALAVYGVPFLGLLPFKFAALWLLGRGDVVWGIGLIVVAKLVGTAVLARLFTLTKPALMQLPWFAQSYTAWAGWKANTLGQVRASWVWRQMRLIRRRMLRLWFNR